jgi:hypothetical protein
MCSARLDRGTSTTAIAVVAAVVGLIGCGSVTSNPDAAGHGGTTGSAGTSGSAGTTGAGGGTTGTAGTSAAGRGGATGTAGGGAGGTTGNAARGGTTGMAGRGGTTGRGGVDGGGGTMGAGGRGGMTGTGGTGGICSVLCTTGRMCCDGACVNLQNDPFNCGTCGNVCPSTAPYCSGGMCGHPTCDATVSCVVGSTCCGSMCCGAGQLCCEQQGPVTGGATCFTPTADQKTCPAGCAPACVSDRNVKKNITPADTKQILDKVAQLPISTWTYVSEPNAIRHLGPMAQDFHASFGLGDDDRTYNSIDAHGVALAAIQALERVVAEQGKRIEKLERENHRLEQKLRAGDPARAAR